MSNFDQILVGDAAYHYLDELKTEFTATFGPKMDGTYGEVTLDSDGYIKILQQTGHNQDNTKAMSFLLTRQQLKGLKKAIKRLLRRYGD